MAKKDDPPVEEKVEYLEEIMGSLKCYQWVITMSMYLTKFPMAWQLISQGIMMPGVQPVYCNNTNISMETLNGDIVKQLHKEACDPSCPQIMVGTQFYERSIIGDYELYCDRAIFRMVAQLLVMAGVFLGNFIFGYAADKIGRKWPLIIGMLGQPILGTWVAFSPGIGSFLAAKFFLCVFVGGTMITGFVIFSEVVGKKWRPIFGILYHMPFSLGHLILPGLAYLFREDWRYFQLFISLSSIIFIYLIWVIYESPRWLIAVGKVEEGITNLERIAKFNGLPTEDIRAKVLAEVEKKKLTQTEAPKKGKVKDLFKTKYMGLITIGMCLNWFAVTCGYYGMAQLASAFTHSFYLNNVLAAALQIPGVLLPCWTVNAWGRKKGQIFANLVSAIGCLATAFTPNAYKIYPAAIAMFGLAFCFPSTYVYSGESFPTTIRNIGVGSASSFGRVGGMLSPVFEYLKEYGLYIPLVIFACTSGCAAIYTFFLPETRGRELPNTVEDISEWRKKQQNKEETNKIT